MLSSARTSLMIVLAGLSFAAQYGLGGAVRALDPPFVEPPVTARHRWNPQLFRILSFGHPASAVDWLMIRFQILDPSLAKIEPGTHPQFFYDLDLATDIDPAFYSLYVAGANTLAVIRSDGVGAAQLLEKANRFRKEELPKYREEFRTRHWSNAWAIPVLQAYVALFELNDLPAAGRAFREAAEIPAVPPHIRALAARFENEDGAFEVGARILGFMQESAKTETEKQELEKKLTHLRVQHFVFTLNRNLGSSKGKVPDRDPWGGMLSKGPDGKWMTTTKYEKVMGLP